ncbi:HAMP domain-containing histidine kinase [Olsenella sp. KGMB02461]|nr:HAMP domain-containing histidine kinase [Olsenella sp. KGMB02461]
MYRSPSLCKSFLKKPGTPEHAADTHGATITVDSRLNEGSLFTVHFPLS